MLLPPPVLLAVLLGLISHAVAVVPVADNGVAGALVSLSAPLPLPLPLELPLSGAVVTTDRPAFASIGSERLTTTEKDASRKGVNC